MKISGKLFQKIIFAYVLPGFLEIFDNLSFTR